MEQKPSMKDRKQDILKSYEELLEKYREKEKLAKGMKKEEKVKKAEEQETVKKASTNTVENIVKGFADLKLGLSETLTNLSDQLIDENNKLKEIQEAIAIEKKNLEEIYDIQVAAETLSNLIEDHEDKKKEFEEEMAAMREQWRKEQEQHDQMVKERDENLRKEREREEEEYKYNLAKSRKRDKDAHEEEKAALKKALKEEREQQEKELAEREAAVAAREQEIAELRARVDAFPSELEQAVEQARKETVAQVEKEAMQKAELTAKEAEGQRNVANLKIKSLEDMVSKQKAQIDKLSKQLNDATMQVQDIAVKAIEGASGTKALSAVNKIALEQARKKADVKEE